MFKRRDPVCGVRVSKNTEYFLIHQGKTYYFDCPACKDTFKEHPQNYVKQPKDSFLNWLAKGSKDVPKSCHEKK